MRAIPPPLPASSPAVPGAPASASPSVAVTVVRVALGAAWVAALRRRGHRRLGRRRDLPRPPRLGARRPLRLPAAPRPGAAARRARVGAGTPAWDLAWVAVFWPSMIAAPAVAGVDLVRLGHVPLPLWVGFARGW